jgi:8-oxo-dGTP pyrophosphatase MutT (NUDIX family)
MAETHPFHAAPRLAATLLLVRDDPFEVLMVRRHARAVFASALVFPGGAVDPDDSADAWLPLITGAEQLSARDRAIRIAAARETYEEVALSLAVDAEGRPCRLGPAPFRDAVAAAHAHLELGSLVPFGHWITPEGEPRRFDTHFFIAAAPDGQEAVSDGDETVSLEWVQPAEMIGRAQAGERAVMFPTLMNLMRLAESANVADALRAARNRPVFTVHARIEERGDGSRHVVIPAEAGYAATEFPAS